MVQNQRKHKRFSFRMTNIESRVNAVGKADIVDMSMGGVLLRTDGKVAIGRECSIQFGYRGMQYPVKGKVVRSELCGLDEKHPTRTASLYLVGVMFAEGTTGPVKELLDSIEQSKKVEVPSTANWRFRDLQFNLTTPSEKVLDFPGQFTIQDISRSGVIIRTDHQLKPDSMLLLELSLGAAAPASFMGKVAYCRASREQGQGSYAVGVEFTELSERAREFLGQFVDSLKNGDA